MQQTVHIPHQLFDILTGAEMIDTLRFINENISLESDNWSWSEVIILFMFLMRLCLVLTNDLTIGWQNLNPLSHPNATLAPEDRQAKASGENLNYVTLALQTRQARPSGKILNYLLSP